MIRRCVIIYFLLAMIEAGIGLYIQFPFLSGVGGWRVGEYSLFRLILTVIFLALFLVCGILIIRIWRQHTLADCIFHTVSSPWRSSWFFGALGTCFVAFGAVLLMPSYRWGSWSGFVERMIPLIGWIELVNMQTILCLWLGRTHPKKEKSSTNLSGNFLLPGGIAFFILISIMIWISRTKVGIIPSGHTRFYSVGVPLLPGQILLMICLAIVFAVVGAFWVKRSSINTQSQFRMDLVIGMVIWGITAVLWMSADLPRNFFLPGPYPPNNVIYPYSDIAIWDMGGQFALIGQGFDNSDPFADHVGWMGVLAFLQLIVGDDYAVMSMILAGLLAIFPALMYWSGKLIHSRSAGFFIAGLATLHELNAFSASNMIDLSHARFLLTEYPTRVGLAALTILLILWFRSPRQNSAYALPVGSLLGIMIFLRFNTLVLPFGVFIGALIIFGRDLKSWLRASILIIVSLLIILSPWMWRSWNLSGTPFFFAEKVNRIFNEKFRSKPPVAPTPTPSDLNYEKESPLQAQLIRNESSSASLIKIPLPTRQTNGSNTVPKMIVGYFMHNLVTSVFILPTSLTFDDVKHTIYDVHEYWDKKGTVWKGNLTMLETILLVVNLLFMSIGLGVSWQKWQFVGLIPLGIFLIYNMSLAVARTSGGRYIVPMDWVVLYYWGIGLTVGILWATTRFGIKASEHEQPCAQRLFSYRLGWLSLLPFLLFTSAMTVMDRIIPEKYPIIDKTEVFNIIKQSGVLEQSDISEQQLATFLLKKNSLAYWGRALYPRFYGIGKGEYSGGIDAYEPENYPRLAFTLIGGFAKRDIVLAWMIHDLPKLNEMYFPNASEVLVVGCRRSRFSPKKRTVVDALFIVLLEEKPLIYVRNPSGGLKCPIKAPVCSSNNECKQMR